MFGRKEGEGQCSPYLYLAALAPNEPRPRLMDIGTVP